MPYTKRHIRVKFLTGLLDDRRDNEGQGQIIVVPQGAVGTVLRVENVQDEHDGKPHEHFSFVVLVDWALVQFGTNGPQEVQPVKVQTDLGDVEQFGVVEVEIPVEKKPQFTSVG